MPHLRRSDPPGGQKKLNKTTTTTRRTRPQTSSHFGNTPHALTTGKGYACVEPPHSDIWPCAKCWVNGFQM
eukprot:10056367-Heterocapsa_arctica.AAC.1